MFNIFNLETKQLVERLGELIAFNDPRLADIFCKEAAKEGKRYQPRPMAGDKRWRDREHRRIGDGTYKRPHYLNYLEIESEHFLHLADKRPGELSYTKDAPSGMADKQTVISLQGYIEKYCKSRIDPDRIKMIHAEHAANTMTDDGLQFATTPEDIVKVYTQHSRGSAVASSCMRHRLDQWHSMVDADVPFHPCHVYGAGDLAVAYLANSDGETLARALCWPEKKIYSRMYAGGDALHNMLLKRGFEKSAKYYSTGAGRNEGFVGARLLRITHPEDENCYLVPYSDDVARAWDDGEHLIMGTRASRETRPFKNGGEYIDIQRTNCWSQDPSRAARRVGCQNCAARVRLDYIINVYMDGNGATQRWCEACVEAHTFQCARSGRRYHNSVLSVRMFNGSIWSQWAFERYGFECQRTGGRYHTDQCRYVIISEGADPARHRYRPNESEQRWGPDATREHAWQCGISGNWYSDAIAPVMVTGSDGRPQKWGSNFARDYAFKSDVDGVLYNVNDMRVISGGRRVHATQEAAARAATTALVVVPEAKPLEGEPPCKLDTNRRWRTRGNFASNELVTAAMGPYFREAMRDPTAVAAYHTGWSEGRVRPPNMSQWDWEDFKYQLRVRRERAEYQAQEAARLATIKKEQDVADWRASPLATQYVGTAEDIRAVNRGVAAYTLTPEQALDALAQARPSQWQWTTTMPIHLALDEDPEPDDTEDEPYDDDEEESAGWDDDQI